MLAGQDLGNTEMVDGGVPYTLDFIPEELIFSEAQIYLPQFILDLQKVFCLTHA